MDELKEVWNNWSPVSEDISVNQKLDNQKSTGVIEKLRSNVQKKLYYAIFFTAAFGVALPFVFPLASQILFTIMIAAYLVGAILLYQELQILNQGVDMTQNMLEGLITYKNRIQRVLRYEEVVGLCLYPVSISAGFFFGMKTVDRDAEIMNSSRDWFWFITTLVIFTVLGHWLARWMNKKVFGKYIAQLDNNIELLKNTN